MFEEIKKKALEDHIPIIMDDTLDVIKEIFQEEKPQKILEIGTAVGYSAICFIKSVGKEAKVDTIELDEERAKQAIENIETMNMKDNINVIIGNAVDILPTLNNEYDIIFIDAAKGKYPFFLEQAIRLIKPNGLILADNILYKGYVMSDYNKHKQRTAVRNLREYIKQVTENANLETKILEVGDGLAVTRARK